MADLRHFHNALRIMKSIDLVEVREAGIDMDADAYRVFAQDPFTWLIRAGDDDADRLWTIIERRAPRRAQTSSMVLAPAPWTHNGCAIESADGRCVAICSPRTELPDGVGMKAHAQAISALPDLLEALKEARERMLGSSPAIRALIAKTDAAIAKAEIPDLPNPAGATIRSHQGNEAEAEPGAGSAPVGSASPAPNALDRAWTKINALGGTTAPGDTVGEAYCNAVDEALEILEALGARDVVRA